MEINGKKAVIVGGASGMAKASAELLRAKGADIAIQVAKRVGIPLKIVGPAREEPGNEAYYREKIAPFLGPECTHLGEVTNEEKLRVLSGAAAMIFPMRWKEPMGLVMIESLAGEAPGPSPRSLAGEAPGPSPRSLAGESPG